ncbi:OLC1v1003721C1 [Oldenlandia corymbosa var. corymbosa]|uniref:OLC1v1003721C1 n=1 Tax=Oldenlandia corymbosa var. corymbosa TaxID=529605 RepID=A0AAV1DAU7_OLDCO|nr:OLC1v1003721C1 [Oldenlandia corymbosa var. corymbosa]
MRIQANEDDSPAIRKAKQKVNEKKEALKKASFFSKTTTLSMRIQANEDDSPAIRKAIEKVNEKKEAVKKARDARDKAMKDGKKSTEELGKYLSEVQEAERELTAAEEYLKELRRDKGY